MKTSSQSIKQVAVVSGLFLGAFVLSALAADWTAPTAIPPSNNTPAPINVGSSAQAKVGFFAIGQATNPELGVDFQVAKLAKLGSLYVNGDAKIFGTTTTDRLTVGGVDAGNAGYVLTNKGGTGEAEWKRNTSGLSGASRIYCAAASDGQAYFIPVSDTEYYDLINTINTEVFTDVSSGFLWNDQLLDTSDPKHNNSSIVGLLKSSFNDTTWTRRTITTTNAPKASCETGKKLIFHSMVGWAKVEDDDADRQNHVSVIKGDYTNNSISCVAKGHDRPKIVIGVGLCI